MITTTWKPLDPDLAAFLSDFERRSAIPESDQGEQFAAQFLTADPNTATVVTREALVASLPMRRSMFEAAGLGHAVCVAASQLDLDDRHVLVTADWDTPRRDGESVRLESTYLVRRDAGGCHILVYLNHRDLAAILGAA
ncbi:hypothetical protein [Nocardia sp. alder85J]|uniref:hypothetical protein n=1 Tax=Nocardia sp. alder85J TaxID=2862949 RepID=UPI001CD6FBB7|nr:hypothetical protein [Nocardia sp. alder85J]MCX4092988.1 hypothetical protein [Nocardia sp. alder85J]